MVSSIIFVVGFLKLVLLNKIPNKELRKSILAFTTVLFSFASTAVYFVINQVDWNWYWLASAVMTVISIVAYWFYENTNLRTLIHKIGYFTIDKFATIAKKFIDGKDVTNDIKTATNELKELTKQELKKANSKTVKTDKELQNL